SRDVIVHFNSEHVAVPGVTNNSIWFISSKAIRSDAHVVRPILSNGKTLGEHSNDTCAKNQRNERDDGFLHSVSWESRNLQNSNRTPNCILRGVYPCAVELTKPNCELPRSQAVFACAKRGVFMVLNTSARNCRVMPSFGTISLKRLVSKL